MIKCLKIKCGLIPVSSALICLTIDLIVYSEQVSTREVDMAIGGDQGGSIRVPASWCGIVGLKPTFSLVPYSGAVSLATSIDHLGPMARKVQDCALLLEVVLHASFLKQSIIHYYLVMIRSYITSN